MNANVSRGLFDRRVKLVEEKLKHMDTGVDKAMLNKLEEENKYYVDQIVNNINSGIISFDSINQQIADALAAAEDYTDNAISEIPTPIPYSDEEIRKMIINFVSGYNNFAANTLRFNNVFDTDGEFTGKIRPTSIETAALFVGTRSQQLALNKIEFRVLPYSSGTGVLEIISSKHSKYHIDGNYIKDNNNTTIEQKGIAGFLFHYGFGTDTQPKVYVVYENALQLTETDNTQGFYIYAQLKATKTEYKQVTITDAAKFEQKYMSLWINSLGYKRVLLTEYDPDRVYYQKNPAYVPDGIGSGATNEYISIGKLSEDTFKEKNLDELYYLSGTTYTKAKPVYSSSTTYYEKQEETNVNNTATSESAAETGAGGSSAADFIATIIPSQEQIGLNDKLESDGVLTIKLGYISIATNTPRQSGGSYYKQRKVDMTYGSTTIDGRLITTGRIEGNNVAVDLDTGEITGNIKFQLGQGQTADALSFINNSINTGISNIQIGGRNLMPNTETRHFNLYREATATFTDNQNVSEWNATNAIRATGSKGTYYIYGTYQKSEHWTAKSYVVSIYVKNLGQSKVVIVQNGSSAKKCVWQAGEEGRKYFVVDGSAHTGANIGFNFVDEDSLSSYSFDFIYWHPKVEEGNTPTDWSPAPEDTEAELNALQSDLQNQIDQKIETFAQSTDPSVLWATSTEKDRHVGDLWQYTGSTTQDESLIHNNTYKYTKQNSTTYIWNSFSATNELFDAIDGKTTIYYNSTEQGYVPTGVQDGDYLLISEGANQGKSFRWKASPSPGSWISVQDYQDAISKIAIGGRNLLLNSYIAASIRGDSTALIPAQTAWAKTFVSTTNVALMFGVGETYTISFDYEITAIQSGQTLSNKWLGFGLYSLTDGWIAQLWDTQGLDTVGAKAHFSKTFTMPATLASDTVMNIYTQRYGNATNQTVIFSNLKIERGNKATDWTPAPEDTQADILAERVRLNNIDSNLVFSIAEKQSFRPTWFAISDVDDTTTNATYIVARDEYANGSLYQHYNLKKAENATTLKTALKNAFDDLKDYLNTCGLYTNSDYKNEQNPFSQSNLRELLAAYYTAEYNLENYADHVDNLVATCETASNNNPKVVVCPELQQDMLTDPLMKMKIKFANDQKVTVAPYFVFKNTSGGSNIRANGAEVDNTYIYYHGSSHGVSADGLYWIADMEVEFAYKAVESVYTSSGNKTALVVKMTDEGQFTTIMSFSKALQGETTVAGGLILTEIIRAGSGSLQAGMNGTDASRVAFWAGGDVGYGENFGLPVVIMRDGDAQLGLLRFSHDGGISMPDSTGFSRLNITAEPLGEPAGSDSVEKSPNGAANYPSTGYTDMGTFSTSAQQSQIWDFKNWLKTGVSSSHNGMIVRIKSGSTFTLGLTDAVSGGRVTVYIQAGSNKKEIVIVNAVQSGSVSVTIPNDIDCIYRSSSNNGSISIGFKIDNDASRGLSVSSGIMYQWYHDAAQANTNIASDGMMVQVNTTNLFMAKQTATGVLTTTIKGESDLPGILWGGVVASNGTPTKKCGNTNVSLAAASSNPHPTVGVYNLTLSGVDKDPIAIATVNSTSSSGWTAKIHTNNKTTISVRVYSDNTAADSNFNLLIIGTN